MNKLLCITFMYMGMMSVVFALPKDFITFRDCKNISEKQIEEMRKHPVVLSEKELVAYFYKLLDYYNDVTYEKNESKKRK